MKIFSVVGARPQFIKFAPVSLAIARSGHDSFLLHTGQHYDYGMSKIFFDELGIPEPEVNLGVGSGLQGWQTAQMLQGIEAVLMKVKPDIVLVYGDTNSTLAGALAAAKLHVKLAHVEAGLRSYNRLMPEEHNRVLADHCSDLLFCPTQTAVDNLGREGIYAGVHLVGDTMYDAVLQFGVLARSKSTILNDLGLQVKKYLLLTIHRAYNTDDESKLREIFSAFDRLDEQVIFPVHPRTQKALSSIQAHLSANFRLIDPVGYLDMLMLEQNARLILTDSGGMQKEAYFFKVPCLTLRPETEWVETTAGGWNQLVGTDPVQITRALETNQRHLGEPEPLFGDGHAGQRIVELLAS